MFDTFLSFIRIIGLVLVGIITLVYLMAFVWIIVYLCKGRKIPKRTIKSKFHKRNIFLRLFFDFPRALARDFYNRDPDAMKIHGIYMFCGEQGSGKTIAAIQFLREQLQRYPKIKVKSNISIDFQDGKITHWREILNSNNGKIGEIDFIDEVQNWFSSNESKNFPVEMLSEVTQQRKQHKVIVGTSQVFTRMSKPLREQTKFLCLPVTIAACLTIVRIYKPVLDDMGTMISKKFVRMYFFVHDEELRNCYNTFEKVERLSSKGFQSAAERGVSNV